uniref:protein-serine/threonine phosphatase n=1 Tax=Strongyloides stercoralis TaxID=6248 RepID=A0A0K0E1S6_STRER
MGAYLDRPITESHYDYGKNDKIKYVAASMQGWRTEQEDAHNAILDLEKGIHMFAVYDGHGGKDVSTYTADHFPQYLIQQENWKNKEFSNALNDAFISFDDVLRQPEVLKILSSIAQKASSAEDAHLENDSEESKNLTNESGMKIEDVLQRYGVQLNKAGISTEELVDQANALLQKKNSQKEDSNDKNDGVEIGKKRAPPPLENKPTKMIKLDDIDDKSESSNDSDYDDEKAAEDAEEELSDEENVEDEENEDECSMDDIDEEEDYANVGPETPGLDSGTTACVVVIHNENITVANAGDSRAVLCRNGKAIELSFDHKPEDKSEKSRIVKAGGTISADGRVNGGLNLSRALGDHYYKQNKDLPLEEQMISAKPDIIEDKITDEDEFLIIACDGIWNSMSSQEVVDFVKELWGKETLKQICDKIMANCLADNTDGDGTGCDNMTIIIVDLKNTTELGQFDNIEDTKQIE